MSNQNNQNQESIEVKILNAKNQEFVMWFEPIQKKHQIQHCLELRKQLLQPIFIELQPEESVSINLPSKEPLEIVSINLNNQIIAIHPYSLNRQFNEKEFMIKGASYVLIADKGFSQRFSLVTKQSTLTIDTASDFNLEQGAPPIPNFELLTSAEVLKALLQDQKDFGLRSQFPSYYIWYHDILFMVGDKGFPDYSASAPITQLTLELIDKLHIRAIDFTLRQPVYQRHFMSSTSTITKEATWWGMENCRKFVQTNHNNQQFLLTN